MGYTRAARRLGIKTVDIQHGEQHGMYRGWKNVPKEGYDIMPSLFWCWGEESAGEINKWASNTITHQAIVAGNPWISTLTKKNRTEQASSRKNKALVMVSVPNKDFDMSNIYRAIKDSPNNIIWHIQLHPGRMGNKVFRENLEKEFSYLNDKEIEIQNETSPTFYDLLPKMDFLVTPWSTAVYEALTFKVHPIITSGSDRAVFENYLNKGLFSLAETSEKILEIIKKDKREFNFEEETPYMETDREKMKEIIIDLLK